jgi:hypothetical protein
LAVRYAVDRFPTTARRASMGASERGVRDTSREGCAATSSGTRTAGRV